MGMAIAGRRSCPCVLKETQMADYLNIGSTPAGEDRLSVGHPLARAECTIYKRQLMREFPEGDFRVKSFNHDFGTYFEVVAWYEDNDSDDPTERTPTQQAAWSAESSASEHWDAQALAELKAAGIREAA